MKLRDARGHWPALVPLFAVVLLLAALGMASAGALSALRAFVAGESQYSKGYREAVYQLVRYAASHDEADYRRFGAALAVPLADQRARLALEASPRGLDAARVDLLQGGNHADDIDGLTWLYRSLRQAPPMAEAIDIWAQADDEIIALLGLGTQLHSQITEDPGDSARVHALMAQVGLTNDRLTALAQRFSTTLGEASRLASRTIQIATALLALLLAALGVALGLRALRRQAQAEQALRASEERLQRALDASGLTLWDFDVASGEVFLSESWARALGAPPGQTRTTFAALASLVPGSEREAAMQSLVRALKNPDADYRAEHRVRRADGTSFWNLSEGRVVQRGGDGRALRMVGTNRDISELKQAEAARGALQAQLRESQKMEAIGTLAGGIAHDFNNILGAILGNVALARDEFADTGQSRFSLEQINKAALRARTLVQQILAYSRRQPQELRRRALAPLVHEAVALLQSTLPASVALQLELSGEPLHVLADATQMQQVLMNLCTNAWHALQGRSGRVLVGLRPMALDGPEHGVDLSPGRYAHLWVADDGCGMDAATRARVFEPFFTTKPVGQGTGLGLSVVQGIVAAHHGVITLRSTPGQGSCFDLYFPLLDEPDTPTPASAWAELDAPCDGAQGRHVLVVDDDEVMLVLVQRLLQRIGCRVSCLQDPRAAIERVRLRPYEFDMVVSDFNMPQCSGLDVARAVAQIRADLPVIISSGHVTQELHDQALRDGARGLVHKENTLEELGVLVQRVLQQA